MSDRRRWTKVVVATSNPYKVKEIEAIMKDAFPNVTFVALSDMGDYSEAEESGETFMDNALIKARAAVEQTGLPAIADESGLVVDALDEEGEFTTPWSTDHSDDDANNEKLIENMADVPDEERTARYRTVAALVFPDGTEYVAEGSCEGTIGYEPRGENGFGYDKLFWPRDIPGKTMAELDEEELSSISHRTRAFEGLVAQLT